MGTAVSPLMESSITPYAMKLTSYGPDGESRLNEKNVQTLYNSYAFGAESAEEFQKTWESLREKKRKFREHSRN
jgi:alpha-glucuronidase